MEAKSETRNRRGPLIIAGILLGLGLGGFVDGIVLHQLLQWHHMLSSIRPAKTVAGLELNMFWDGLFEASTWILTVSGLVVLWRAGEQDDVPWSSRTLVGALLVGAGAFNLVEGLIDHQVLGIHHVKPGPNELAWDVGFLASGVVLAVTGWILLRTGQQESPTG